MAFTIEKIPLENKKRIGSNTKSNNDEVRTTGNINPNTKRKRITKSSIFDNRFNIISQSKQQLSSKRVANPKNSPIQSQKIQHQYDLIFPSHTKEIPVFTLRKKLAGFTQFLFSGGVE